VKDKEAWLAWLILAVIILLALSLRFYRLDGQSLWADEGNSAALAARNLTTITRDAAHDIHPPLYYYLLHFWVRIFGNSEVALRSLSALMGSALVLMTYLLGQELFNRRVALIASFLAAISSFQIYYSQETRMYIPAALWAALAVYFFLKWMRSRGGLDIKPEMPADGARNRVASLLFAALYVLFTTAALYTHYFSFTIPLVTNLAYGLGMIAYERWRRPKAVVGWAVAQLIMVGLYYPWLRLAGGQLATWPAISEPFSLSFLLQNLLRVFSLGLSVDPKTTPALLIFGLLLLLGVLPCQLSLTSGKKLCRGLPRAQLHSLIFTLIYLCLPILAMYLLSLSRPAYDPKLLLLATPAYHLMIARGLGGEWLGETMLARQRVRAIARWPLTGLALLFVVGTSAQSLTNYYFDEEYARDDYRGLARYITAAAQEGDAIILNAPGQIDIFSYYYKGALPIYPLPGERPLDEDKTEDALERIVAGHQGLYALFWGTDESDPGQFIEGWLDRRTFKALDSWHGNVRLAIYAVPQEDISRDIKHPRQLKLGDEIAFLGYSLANSEVRAGDILQLTLFWQAWGEIEERYKVFTHVLDSRSHIVGQRDAEPVGGARPTTTWQEGEIIADNYGLLVLPATPPGEHQLEIGMYDLETGERLPILEDEEVLGDNIVLEPIQVLRAEAPPLVEALDIQYRREVDYGQLRLLGYDLSKLGYEHQPEEPLHPGDILHLTLYWQPVEEIDVEFTLTLQLLDESGTPVVSRDVQPVGGVYPPTVWEVGEIVRDQYNLLLPAELPSGRYDFFLQVHELGAEGAPLLLKSLGIGI
jgi:mannosyltransferase